MSKNIRNIYGEYDPPLPPVNHNPSKEDKEKMKKLLAKYERLAENKTK